MPTETAQQTLPPTTTIAFSPTLAPISDALSAYIVALTAQGTQTIRFRTGAGRILRDLSLHWPRMEHSDDIARELCIKITRSVFPLAKALFAQAVEISATFSPSQIKAPTYMEAMSTLIVFDTKNKVERHCFLSKEQPTPQEEMRLTPRGIVLLCRPLNYLYHTMSDDRKRHLYPGVGLYELAERQLNALHTTLDYSLRAPPIDSIAGKNTDDENETTSDFATSPWPVNRGMESALLWTTLNKAFSPDLQPPLSQQQRKEVETQQATPPPSRLPETQKSPDIAGQSQPPVPSSTTLLPTAPAAHILPPRTRVEIERQAMHDVHNGKLPNVALYSEGNQYYRLAYDAYMHEHKTSLALAGETGEVVLPAASNRGPSPLLASSSGNSPIPASTVAQRSPASISEMKEPSLAQPAPRQAALMNVPQTARTEPTTSEASPQLAPRPAAILEVASNSQSVPLSQRQPSDSPQTPTSEMPSITRRTNAQGYPSSGLFQQHDFRFYSQDNSLLAPHNNSSYDRLQPLKYTGNPMLPIPVLLPRPAPLPGQHANSLILLRQTNATPRPPRSYARALLWKDILLPLIAFLGKDRKPYVESRIKRISARSQIAPNPKFPHRPLPRPLTQDVKMEDVPFSPQS